MATSKRIPCLLVVEDETAVRDLIVAFLKAGGHENIVTAGNAEEALYYLFRDPGLNIQLAVVDLVLPNASGLALIRRLRNAKSPRRKTTPVIVLTARTDTDTYKAAARRGIQGYLMKPISPGLLLRTVNDVLIKRGLTPPQTKAGPEMTGTTLAASVEIPSPPSLEEHDTGKSSQK
jgi:DNA-binding response OmpR family regulator